MTTQVIYRDANTETPIYEEGCWGSIGYYTATWLNDPGCFDSYDEWQGVFDGIYLDCPANEIDCQTGEWLQPLDNPEAHEMYQEHGFDGEGYIPDREELIDILCDMHARLFEPWMEEGMFSLVKHNSEGVCARYDVKQHAFTTVAASSVWRMPKWNPAGVVLFDAITRDYPDLNPWLVFNFISVITPINEKGQIAHMMFNNEQWKTGLDDTKDSILDGGASYFNWHSHTPTEGGYFYGIDATKVYISHTPETLRSGRTILLPPVGIEDEKEDYEKKLEPLTEGFGEALNEGNNHPFDGRDSYFGGSPNFGLPYPVYQQSQVLSHLITQAGVDPDPSFFLTPKDQAVEQGYSEARLRYDREVFSGLKDRIPSIRSYIERVLVPLNEQL